LFLTSLTYAATPMATVAVEKEGADALLSQLTISCIGKPFCDIFRSNVPKEERR